MHICVHALMGHSAWLLGFVSHACAQPPDAACTSACTCLRAPLCHQELPSSAYACLTWADVAAGGSAEAWRPWPLGAACPPSLRTDTIVEPAASDDTASDAVGAAAHGQNPAPASVRHASKVRATPAPPRPVRPCIYATPPWQAIGSHRDTHACTQTAARLLRPTLWTVLLWVADVTDACQGWQARRHGVAAHGCFSTSSK